MSGVVYFKDRTGYIRKLPADAPARYKGSGDMFLVGAASTTDVLIQVYDNGWIEGSVIGPPTRYVFELVWESWEGEQDLRSALLASIKSSEVSTKPILTRVYPVCDSTKAVVTRSCKL